MRCDVALTIDEVIGVVRRSLRRMGEEEARIRGRASHKEAQIDEQRMSEIIAEEIARTRP